jgi:glutamate racemase
MTQRSADPVGIFDSGIGGLTVTRGVVDRLPFESLLYLGDTARVPYGNKSPETIQRYSLNISARLQALGAKALVIACNTDSTIALGALRERFSVPFVGTVPAIKPAAAQTKSGLVGVAMA